MNVIELFIFDASIAFKSFMKIVSTFSFVISKKWSATYLSKIK